MSTNDRQKQAFAKYIEGQKILIADSSAVARTSIAGILTSVGAKTANIVLVQNYDVAEQEIERVKPKVVICDYDLGKKCGLDLLQKQRFHKPESKDSLFILVTANSSQCAVAKAAEEDVDTYILKPFTPEVLRNSIIKTAENKTNPSDYVKVIERGKGELASGKYEDAIKSFTFAKTLEPAPSLACFYLGQASLMKQLAEQAEGSYLKGLEYNKIHYKCLVGLYELFSTAKRHAEAYDVIKKISYYFPANPQRLTAVLRLAIVNKSYDDVERYYRIFTGIDERNEEMIKYVCAALVVCGKYYLQQNFGSRAIELFQKAAMTAQDRTKILREIIVSLVQYDLVKEADEFMKRFPPQTQSRIDYQAMDFLVMDKMNRASAIIDRGRKLIEQSMHDPVIYQILIKRSQEAGFGHAAEDLHREATKRWPDQTDAFNAALKGRTLAKPPTEAALAAPSPAAAQPAQAKAAGNGKQS